ncbi:MAG: acetate--CoA ligase family protein [Pseudohongiellaceae bacterium]
MISFSERWHFYRGHVKGLQQSSAGGVVRIRLPSGLDEDKCDKLLSFLFDDEPLPPVSINDGDWFAKRYIQWALAIQKHCRVLVSDRFYISAPERLDNGFVAYDVLIPMAVPLRQILASLQWIDDFLETAAPLDTENHPALMTTVEDDKRFSELKIALKKHAEPGLNYYWIARAAYRMEIPLRRIAPAVYGLGTGCWSRWLDSTISDATPAIGMRIAKLKQETSDLLHSAGFPAPRHGMVESNEHAIELAQSIGFPVVIKPADADQGRGVSAGLENAEDVTVAYELARAVSAQIMVQKHLVGFTHRLTVFNGKIIRAVKRIAGGVTGDGNLSVAELVKVAQDDPRLRRMQRRSGVMVLSLDDEALGMLKRAGMTPDSVPALNEYICLRRRDNVNAGGTNVEIALDQVHPDNRLLAIRASELLRLDIAGVDLITTDIARSWLETEAGICEINAQPQLGIRGQREIYRAILAELLPEPYRIPVHLALAPSSFEWSMTDKKELLMPLSCQGLSAREGLWIDGQQVSRPFDTGFAAACALLARTDVNSALCCMTAEDVLKSGSPIDKVDSVIVIGHDTSTPEEREALRQAQNLIEKR